MRIMKRENYSITKKYFSDMLSCPITVKNIKINGGVIFYNSHHGPSTVKVRVVPFKNAESQNITVKELKEKVTGRFDFIAAFNWIGQEKKVKKKREK